MVALRPPSQVMRLARMGAFHQTRLSFMRQLTRRMAREKWRFVREVFEIHSDGTGEAVYSAHLGTRCYSLVAFAHDLPDDARSDRVIAEAWDATFALFDGIPSKKDLARLKKNIPFQEAGRLSERELTLSRANKSVRLWDHVLEALSHGRQPDLGQIADVGYLMRTTAVYGSGKFGAADRELIADRAEFNAPFQPEMLTVYLIRWFVRDLIEYIAKLQGGSRAAALDDQIARKLGIGNSTGLGMAPFLINHPILLNNWISAREKAIARVREQKSVTKDKIAFFIELLEASLQNARKWRSQEPDQKAKIAALCDDLEKTRRFVAAGFDGEARCWNALIEWGEAHLSLEGQEAIASLILEPYADLVDDLCAEMSADETKDGVIDGLMSLDQLRKLLRDRYAWAQKIDWRTKEAQARLWYVSKEKLEPRLGERFSEPIEDFELALAPAFDALRALEALKNDQSSQVVSDFLAKHSEFRGIIRRVQMIHGLDYAEIEDNTISAKMRPIDMLRAKLSFFGASHFDPRSDRWLRITMFADAPYPDELTTKNGDYWTYLGSEV